MVEKMVMKVDEPKEKKKRGKEMVQEQKTTSEPAEVDSWVLVVDKKKQRKLQKVSHIFTLYFAHIQIDKHTHTQGRLTQTHRHVCTLSLMSEDVTQVCRITEDLLAGEPYTPRCLVLLQTIGDAPTGLLQQLSQRTARWQEVQVDHLAVYVSSL